MFDIGWTEMLVVAVIAIVFVGPKELPGMLRTFGKSIKKVRALAGDFQQQFNDAIDDAELDGVRDTIKDVRNLDPTKAIKDKLNPLKSELEDVKNSVTDSVDADPTTLFDESNVPDPPEPVKVDVEAALERQRKIDAEAAKVPPSSGKNAVPGFGGAPAESEVAAKPSAKKSAPRKTATKKSATASKVAKKPTARKTSAKEKPAKKASA